MCILSLILVDGATWRVRLLGCIDGWHFVVLFLLTEENYLKITGTASTFHKYPHRVVFHRGFCGVITGDLCFEVGRQCLIQDAMLPCSRSGSGPSGIKKEKKACEAS